MRRALEPKTLGTSVYKVSLSHMWTKSPFLTISSYSQDISFVMADLMTSNANSQAQHLPVPSPDIVMNRELASEETILLKVINNLNSDDMGGDNQAAIIAITRYMQRRRRSLGERQGSNGAPLESSSPQSHRVVSLDSTLARPDPKVGDSNTSTKRRRETRPRSGPAASLFGTRRRVPVAVSEWSSGLRSVSLMESIV
jgi:hypothetical protein